MRLVLVLALVACSGTSSSHPDGGGGDDGGGDDAPPDAACTEAPAGRCLDATTLESPRVPGTLTDGACQFETFTSPCVYGCADGACQAKACTPFCPVAACVDDGCGGTCGACASGTTFPGVTATNLGVADDAVVAPDGIHVAVIRNLQPIPASCGTLGIPIGQLEVWTVPATGAPTHRTVGAKVALYTVSFTDDGRLLYSDNLDACGSRGDLWVAHLDGAQPQRIAPPGAGSVQARGGGVFYTVRDPADPTPADFDGFVFGLRLPTGAPVQLAKIRYNSFWTPSPNGRAIWVDYNTQTADLVVSRLDGTATTYTSPELSFAFFPQWSPDGSHLAFPLIDRGNKISLHVVGADGSDLTTLDEDCRACADFDATAWSSDGKRLAWLSRPPTFGLDAHVHTLGNSGANLLLTGVVSPTTGGQVFRFTFSNDDARLYAAAGSDQNGWNLMSGTTTASGAMTARVPGLSPDGDRFATSWTEAANGSVLAGRSATGTQVVTAAGATQTIAGGAFERAQLEPTATNPRWLVQHGAQVLSIYSTTGTGAGAALPGFQWTNALSDWAFSGRIPFVFGWAGSAALYPAAVTGPSNRVQQDLMATTAAATGRLGAAVLHYRVAPGRIFFTTAQGGLFVIPAP